MAVDWPLRFGAFFAPFHPVGQSPTLALEYDLERTVVLDRLGYDEVWFGEHHSGGYELIGCPRSSSPPRASAPGTSGWAPASCRCPTTTPGWWPTAWCCSTTSHAAG